MKQLLGPYALSFQTERFYQEARYHWMICGAHNPDELVSWGYSPTQAEAETAAENEVNDLSAGLTHGGRVKVKAVTRRHWLR
jgi:hypothetical protein